MPSERALIGLGSHFIPVTRSGTSMSTRFVNKISPLYSEQQTVSKGEKITFIERGSQTDLFLPSGGITLRVRPGDQVYAGETVLGTLHE